MGHSTEVARVARDAGERLGLDADDLECLEIAALLHDLGRAPLPNGLWDKPGPLSVAELERVRMHSYYTERILARAEPLREIANLAAGAHERSDGSGYHRGLAGAAMTLKQEVLAAADVWVALRSARAHRPAHAEPEARTIFQNLAHTGAFSARVTTAVCSPGDAPSQHSTKRVRPAGLSEREVEVLVAVARGLTNKEIASLLGLSPRTVQTHLAHCFEKTGVRTRAAAATFAARHGLVGVT